MYYLSKRINIAHLNNITLHGVSSLNRLIKRILN